MFRYFVCLFLLFNFWLVANEWAAEDRTIQIARYLDHYGIELSDLFPYNIDDSSSHWNLIMQDLVQQTNYPLFVNHLPTWKIGSGLVFLGVLFMFGNLFCFIVDSLQKKENKRLRFFYSTLSLLTLFFALRLLNAAYELFMKILNTSG